MREYGMVYSAFWTSTTAQGFSDDAKLLGAYLLSCSHGTIAGVCRLSDGYVSDDLNWSLERVVKGFAELFTKGFADRCTTTKWVWIRKFLEWNRPENPNQWKAVWKVAGQIPNQCSWLPDFAALLFKLDGKKLEIEPNPSATLTQTVSKSHTHSDSDPHSDTQPIPNPTQNISAAARPAEPPEFSEFKSVYPKREGSQPWSKALKAIRARLREGSTWNEITGGARRYAAFMRATGKEGSEFVQQAATFCGPDKHFLALWVAPVQKETAMEGILRRAGRGPVSQLDPTVIDGDALRIAN